MTTNIPSSLDEITRLIELTEHSLEHTDANNSDAVTLLRHNLLTSLLSFNEDVVQAKNELDLVSDDSPAALRATALTTAFKLHSASTSVLENLGELEAAVSTEKE